jgi:hypothetical protein
VRDEEVGLPLHAVAQILGYGIGHLRLAGLNFSIGTRRKESVIHSRHPRRRARRYTVHEQRRRFGVDAGKRFTQNTNGIGGPIKGGMPNVRKFQGGQSLAHKTRLFNSALGKFSVVDTLLGIALFTVAN